MVTIRGSHGTTSPTVKSIAKFGWKSKPGGHLGRGIYFWDKSEHYIELAVAWCTYRHAKDGNTSCAVIIADLNAEEESILDCEKEEIVERIIDIGQRFNYNLEDNRDLARLYDFFVFYLEKKGTIIKIIRKRLPPPEGYKYPLMKIKGLPRCCSVRDDKCIKIVETIEC